jgi:hypothetical protein
MAKVPARARSSTGRTTDVKATTTPYHIPYNTNYRVPKQGFLLPGPDRPPAPAPARPVVGLPGPGVQAPAQGAPPAPGSAVIDWVNAHYAPALRQHVEQMLAANPQRAQQLMHPAAPAAPATQPPMPGLPAMPTGAIAAPAPAATGAPTPADPYANLPPDVASLLRGIDQQTQQEAAAIQSVNAAAIPAAQQFAAQLQQGLQGLVGQAGLNPITGAAPQDIPASVAALPYVMTQANQQQAMQQAAQAAGAAYDIPAQLQAAGAQNLAQFYGQAQQGVQSLAQDLIDQQMTQQTDLLKQQLVNQGNLAGRQATGAATIQAARDRTMGTIISSIIANKGRLTAQDMKDINALAVQGARGQSAANVANIRAGASETVAQINADAKRQAAAAAPKGTIGPFAKKPTIKVPGVSWINTGNGWVGVKGSSAGAPKLASPSQRESIMRGWDTGWNGKKATSITGNDIQGHKPADLPPNPTPADIQKHTQDENDATVWVVNQMLALKDNFPGPNGMRQVLDMIKTGMGPDAYQLAQGWIARHANQMKSIWP